MNTTIPNALESGALCHMLSARANLGISERGRKSEQAKKQKKALARKKNRLISLGLVNKTL